ncbi:glycine cleavage system aminomethyltransferase GcvT [Salibacterium salarium]|uniref:Aminomethyltransferase n=1 Tax=Salibacterium salarium TaxID=284579 RepID=A0A3R9PHQ9_9BACI|nr:glycine cleavage system aminomethyltransferase GcvT [Salibacterium salarium]RSL30952.1 glycine cleavage system aminomethyltransferase GcvT [Salibacterium salarium]
MNSIKRTSIYPLYKKYGAKKVEFGGWQMPVYFSSIKEEHHAVRRKAGLFDVSHMGEAIVEGRDAYSFLQYIMTNDLAKLKPGKVMYTVFCNEKGGVVDDLLIYQLDELSYMLVLNASNTKKDLDFLRKHALQNMEIKNMTDDYSLLAIQGPKAEDVLQRLTTINTRAIAPFHFQNNIYLNNVNCIVSRTGYTGEDGFELYCKSDDAPTLWESIIYENKDVLPCGLGARDTLRFEACLPLYGQEIDETISPLEAGLAFAVKFQKKHDFIGKEALLQEKETGVSRQLIGLEMMEQGIPRSGYKVLNENKEIIGNITSGTHSPTLGLNVGIALVEKASVTESCYVQVRHKTLQAKTRPLPFFKKR